MQIEPKEMGQSSSTEEDQDQRTESGPGRDGCRLYGVNLSDNQWPIVYADEYNISFGGLERIHPFDSGKWGKIYKQLKGMSLCVLPAMTAHKNGKEWLIWVLILCWLYDGSVGHVLYVLST